MSDHWEFFPCQMGDHRAFIFYDHGIRESIDSIEISTAVRFRLTYKAPRDNGLPTDEEFDAVADIEDRLTDFIESNQGIYVGRVTVDGHRYFHTFCAAPKDRIDTFLSELRSATGYAIEVLFKDDPEKESYWKELYPTEDDWQMILDRRVVDQLRKSGDDGSIARCIDHWAYFATEAGARDYADWASENRFSIKKLAATDYKGDRKWCVQFNRDDAADLYSINHVTYQLRHKAKELSGEYDGWESPVVNKSPD